MDKGVCTVIMPFINIIPLATTQTLALTQEIENVDVVSLVKLTSPSQMWKLSTITGKISCLTLTLVRSGTPGLPLTPHHLHQTQREMSG